MGQTCSRFPVASLFVLLILISPALNMGALPFITNGNDLTYATHLPTLAATAWYHKKLPDAWPSLQALLPEVEKFASGGAYISANPIDSLTNRELQVLHMIGKGLSTRQTAEALNLSVKNVGRNVDVAFPRYEETQPFDVDVCLD